MSDFSFTIKAGEAFGSGFHESTRGACALLQAMKGEWEPARILDMGTGSGILALGAAGLWERTVIVAADLDAKAVEMTRENAKANGFGERIRAVRANSYDVAEIVESAPYDLVMANILAKTHVELASKLVPIMAPQGLVMLSGILAWLSSGVRAAYEPLGFELLQEVAVGDWRTLLLRR